MNTVYLDQKYIGFISGRLRNFKNKGNGLFEFSHSCEDHGSRKRRGYFYKKGHGYNFFCHNCQESLKFSNFLKKIDPASFEDYRMEVFKEAGVGREPREEVQPMVEAKKEVKLPKVVNGLRPYSDLPASHPALKFAERRKIPTSFYDRIFLCSKFNAWASQYSESFREVEHDVPRMIIPYYNRDKEIFGYTCRAYGSEQPKYIELKVDEDAEMIYGLDLVDENKPIIVLEGPIDSMFLKNAIAVGGASFQSKYLTAMRERVIIVPDNDWKRNKHIADQVIKAATLGFTISLLPDKFNFKDINEGIKKGVSSEEIQEAIMAERRSGPSLLLEIALRRKC